MVALPTAPSIDPPIANDRLKASFGRTLWLSMVVATAIHFMTFAFWPELSAPQIALDGTAMTTLELPPEIVIPEAPAPLTRPALPVVATADVADDLTIPPTTFRDNPVETLAPPPPDRTGADASEGPRFTPFTLAPTVLNVAEVVRVMEREYPPLLRDAGIGGSVRVFFFISEDGQGQGCVEW